MGSVEGASINLREFHLGNRYPELESRKLCYGSNVDPHYLFALRQFNPGMFQSFNHYCSATPFLLLACMAFDQMNAAGILRDEGLLKEGIDNRIHSPISISYDQPLGLNIEHPISDTIPIKAEVVITKEFPLGSTGNGLAIVRQGFPGTYIVHTKPGTQEQYIDRVLNSCPLEHWRLDKYFNQAAGIIGGLGPLDRLQDLMRAALVEGSWGHQLLLDGLAGYGIKDVAELLTYTTAIKNV
jgi:hypothetical protein